MAPCNPSESLSTATGAIIHRTNEGFAIQLHYVLILIVLARYFSRKLASLKNYLARLRNPTCKTDNSSVSSENGSIKSSHLRAKSSLPRKLHARTKWKGVTAT
ncbi:uncharacterized protein MELLADRAFT_101239 [Melampsora larici-populina 98AG31]|uniref:Uncharacterized protein n=1 Tax=Melampsora larici-populina (strain 98AG31 / pathotype 3-4-7) TaxID=747676 RepID=F4R434_MELLP|nr:uncharacterized protein MELLADRAFT_101239 [Melampsora larici-populina 98AG31]EGG12731.1 hypothetical protein MELLADRAFT_101239 [Melampsora larici-populina 98AG31]